MYLTTHVQRLLTPALYVRVKAEEMKYENDVQNVRTLSARNRMPWSRYKELVLQLLPKNTGLYETTILFSLQREDRESAARWMQRLQIGKNILENRKISLPDEMYIEMALRYFTAAELRRLALEHAKDCESTDATTTATEGDDAGVITPAEAKYRLSMLAWPMLCTLVKKALDDSFGYQAKSHLHLDDKRLFTLEQAKARLIRWYGFKKPKQNPTKRGIKRTPGKTCRKCKEAGLKGILVNHATEDCIDSLRERNVRRMKQSAGAKRGRNEGRGGSKEESRRKKVTFKRQEKETKINKQKECGYCKQAGRKYRHPESSCKFAPGGE